MLHMHSDQTFPEGVSKSRGLFFLFWPTCVFGFVSLLSKIVKLQFLFGYKFGLPIFKILNEIQ